MYRPPNQYERRSSRGRAMAHVKDTMKGGECMSPGTERVVRAAMSSWAKTFRLCLLFVVVVAATTGAWMCLVPPRTLFLFMS